MRKNKTLSGKSPNKISGPVPGMSYEYDIQAGGSHYHVIIGRHRYGSYISIPNWNICSELSYLSDRFWNLERLQSCGISETDSRNIADALLEISRESHLR